MINLRTCYASQTLQSTPTVAQNAIRIFLRLPIAKIARDKFNNANQSKKFAKYLRKTKMF